MSAPQPWNRARLLAALLLVPVLLFGPIVAAGQVFLPFLPVVGEPLASENPVAAEAARKAIHATMGDRVYPFLVDQIAARSEVRAGHLPTWEPLQTLGMPLFGGNVAALGYPPNWLAFLLAPERAAAPLALLALFLAGLGTWLFLGRLGLDPRAALVGALGVELGAFAVANLHYYMKVDAALWLPWALWAVEGIAQRRRGSLSALAFAIALSFLGGMVSISVFVLGATALYALVRLGTGALEPSSRRPRLAVRTALGLVLGLAGASYWVLPVAEAAGASLRGGQTVEGTTASSLPAASALGILVPDLVGAPDDPTPPSDLPVAWWLTPASQSVRAENANVLEWNCHALLVLALLALVGLVADPRRAAFPATLLLGCFAFAQGWPLVRLLYALPGLDLGAPQRVLALAWFLWPWLAALGVQALLARAPRALATLLVASLVAALALGHLARGLEPDAWARSLEQTLLARYPGHGPAELELRFPLAGRFAAGRHLAESLTRAACGALALLLAAAAALVLDRRAPRFEHGPGALALAAAVLVPVAAALLPFALVDTFAARAPQALLATSALCALAALAAPTERGGLVHWLPFAALVLIEGFLGTHVNVQGRDVLTEGLFPPSPTIEAVREAAGDGRVLRLDPTPDLVDSQRLARPNLLIPYGIADLTPYPTFTPRQAAELAARIDARMVRRNHVAPLPDPELLEHPLLDLLRAQCVLSVEPRTHPRLVPVLERPGFCIYRRLGALPVARVVPAATVLADDAAVLERLAAPGADFAHETLLTAAEAALLPPVPAPGEWHAGTLESVERPAKDRLRLRVVDTSGGVLVLHEQWAEGWRARIDGGEVPLARADHYCRAVVLPAGTHTVEFSYEPRTLRWGAALALLALLGVVAWELLNPPR